MKKFLCLFVFFLLTIFQVLAYTETEILPAQYGIVLNTNYVDLDSNNFIQTKQVLDIKLLSGIFKGKIVTVENMLTGNPYYDLKLKKGTRVVLHIEKLNGDYIFSIQDIKRSNTLLLLSFIFCAILIYVGKRKGVYSLISIIITCILIYNLLTPMVLKGINPVLATSLICVLSTTITMYFVGGFNRKSSAATIGCTLSFILAALLAFISSKTASLTGFTSEYSSHLFSIHPELDFLSITISTIILATLGAVMDVAMSIASTVNEIFTIDKTKTVKDLFNSGMNVGRDIIGTMANTLILVYLGTSLPLLLLASNIDFIKFINLNQVVTEILSALIGSCAIIICVPITAIVSAKLIKIAPCDYTFFKKVE